MSASCHCFHGHWSFLFSFFPKNREKRWPQGRSAEGRGVGRDEGLMGVFAVCTCTVRVRKLMLGAERREEVKLFFYQALPE